MSLPNKRKGEVLLPEAGDGAYLRFTVDHMEQLEGEFGEDYLQTSLNQIANLKPISFLRTMVEMTLNGGSMDDYPFDMPLDDLKERVLDAIYLAVNGKTVSQFREEAEKAQIEVLKKKADLMRSDPEIRNLLMLETISKLGLSTEDMQDLDQTTSEDTPSSTSLDSEES